MCSRLHFFRAMRNLPAVPAHFQGTVFFFFPRAGACPGVPSRIGTGSCFETPWGSRSPPPHPLLGTGKPLPELGVTLGTQPGSGRGWMELRLLGARVPKPLARFQPGPAATGAVPAHLQGLEAGQGAVAAQQHVVGHVEALPHAQVVEERGLADGVAQLHHGHVCRTEGTEGTVG